MEKKKLLLVAVSVGVVLLIIIGIPLMMIAPRQTPAAFVDREWTTVAEPDPARSVQPVIVEAPVYTDNLSLPDEAALTPLEATETPAVTMLTVPVPQTAAVPDVPVAQAKKPAAAAVAAKPAQTQAKPAAASPVTAKSPAAKPAQAKPAAEPAATYQNYWVQTGAFSTKVRAEGAKESLASKGITSIIDNRDIDGKTWYRVRVGPYVSETEAKYWLALVQSIDGFSESQIRLTQASR